MYRGADATGQSAMANDATAPTHRRRSPGEGLHGGPTLQERAIPPVAEGHRRHGNFIDAFDEWDDHLAGAERSPNSLVIARRAVDDLTMDAKAPGSAPTGGSARHQLSPAHRRVGNLGLALLRLDLVGREGDVDGLIEDLQTSLTAVREATEPVDIPELDVATGYARWAELYDVPGNPMIAYEELVIGDLIDEFAAGPIADLACGTGRHLAGLVRDGRAALGVDGTPEMLAVAKHKIGRDRSVLSRGLLASLPIASQVLSGVVCALALEHVADLRPPFAEFARVLRPGGHLVVSAIHPVMHNVLGWTAWFLDGTGQRAFVATHTHWHSDYLDAARSAGLRVRRCIEPKIPASVAELMAGQGVGPGAVATLEGLPIVLVWEFEKPAAGQ
jgi:SAM-dependent methyltransferase